ncbi:MAG: deoxynucleoside kinase [Oscillochloris sp.]|nr:deoxynucleoside kinase [Oscillochloris sp.]
MQAARNRHIIIAGNIGVGKSTLVGMLAEQLGWTPIYELEQSHPYLDEFYADPQRWGFHSQIWFLTRRFTQHQQVRAIPGTVVQDRSIYEDAAVFAAGLHAQHILSDRDYAIYRQLYTAIVHELPPPELVVYLRASIPVLLQRIAARARPAEQHIRPEYLHSLEQRYEAWVGAWSLCPLLTIDTDNLDLINDEVARQALIRRIAAG